jgi:hypothetical protein
MNVRLPGLTVLVTLAFDLMLSVVGCTFSALIPTLTVSVLFEMLLPSFFVADSGRNQHPDGKSTFPVAPEGPVAV